MNNTLAKTMQWTVGDLVAGGYITTSVCFQFEKLYPKRWSTYVIQDTKDYDTYIIKMYFNWDKVTDVYNLPTIEDDKTFYGDNFRLAINDINITESYDDKPLSVCVTDLELKLTDPLDNVAYMLKQRYYNPELSYCEITKNGYYYKRLYIDINQSSNISNEGYATLHFLPKTYALNNTDIIIKSTKFPLHPAEFPDIILGTMPKIQHLGDLKYYDYGSYDYRYYDYPSIFRDLIKVPTLMGYPPYTVGLDNSIYENRVPLSTTYRYPPYGIPYPNCDAIYPNEPYFNTNCIPLTAILQRFLLYCKFFTYQKDPEHQCFLGDYLHNLSDTEIQNLFNEIKIVGINNSYISNINWTLYKGRDTQVKWGNYMLNGDYISTGNHVWRYTNGDSMQIGTTAPTNESGLDEIKVLSDLSEYRLLNPMERGFDINDIGIKYRYLFMKGKAQPNNPPDPPAFLEDAGTYMDVLKNIATNLGISMAFTNTGTVELRVRTKNRYWTNNNDYEHLDPANCFTLNTNWDIPKGRTTLTDYHGYTDVLKDTVVTNDRYAMVKQMDEETIKRFSDHMFQLMIIPNGNFGIFFSSLKFKYRDNGTISVFNNTPGLKPLLSGDNSNFASPQEMLKRSASHRIDYRDRPTLTLEVKGVDYNINKLYDLDGYVYNCRSLVKDLPNNKTKMTLEFAGYMESTASGIWLNDSQVWCPTNLNHTAITATTNGYALCGYTGLITRYNKTTGAITPENVCGHVDWYDIARIQPPNDTPAFLMCCGDGGQIMVTGNYSDDGKTIIFNEEWGWVKMYQLPQNLYYNVGQLVKIRQYGDYIFVCGTAGLLLRYCISEAHWDMAKFDMRMYFVVGRTATHIQETFRYGTKISDFRVHYNQTLGVYDSVTLVGNTLTNTTSCEDANLPSYSAFIYNANISDWEYETDFIPGWLTYKTNNTPDLGIYTNPNFEWVGNYNYDTPEGFPIMRGIIDGAYQGHLFAYGKKVALAYNGTGSWLDLMNNTNLSSDYYITSTGQWRNVITNGNVIDGIKETDIAITYTYYDKKYTAIATLYDSEQDGFSIKTRSNTEASSTSQLIIATKHVFENCTIEDIENSGNDTIYVGRDPVEENNYAYLNTLSYNITTRYDQNRETAV